MSNANGMTENPKENTRQRPPMGRPGGGPHGLIRGWGESP